MEFPKIIEMTKVKYPPGTKLVAKHNHSLVYTVHDVHTWHDYHAVTLTEEGVILDFVPHYNLYKGVELFISCMELHIDKEYEIVPDDYIGRVIYEDTLHTMNQFDSEKPTELLAAWLVKTTPNLEIEKATEFVEQWKEGHK